MYTAKTASTARFNCWNQESWNHTNIDDWSHYRTEHHHHHYSHAHHHHTAHHHHHHHLPSHIHNRIENHSHQTNNNDINANTTIVRHQHYTEQADSGTRISYNPYNCNSAAGEVTTNQNPSLNETFCPQRIEYCETYPTGSHQYQQEYSYYEQPEACNYTPRQWQTVQNQFSIADSGPIMDTSGPHQVQSTAPSIGQPPPPLPPPPPPPPLPPPPPPPPHHQHHHRAASHHANHPDVLSYHRYETSGPGSVTNVTNNFSVNLALNIPALPHVSDNSQQATVASTIQYKIQTQLEKRITITPHQMRATPVTANRFQASPNSGTTIIPKPAITSIGNFSQESLYKRLKHYRIPKRHSNSKIDHHNTNDPNYGTGDNPNLCMICGKTYARPSTLKTHLRTHSGEKPYRCHFCGKAFTQAANLTAHIRTHSGEKPFPCPICKRRFSQSSSVTTHLRIHSGERPYLCNYCRKSFSDSSTLTKHLRIHSGEKPYQCRMCTLRFSQSGNLNRHMRVHL